MNIYTQIADVAAFDDDDDLPLLILPSPLPPLLPLHRADISVFPHTKDNLDGLHKIIQPND